MTRTVQTGRLPRRFRSADWSDLVPDSIHNGDGSFTTNPEWEAAPYEEAFFDNKKQPLPPMSQYEAFRYMNSL